MILSRSSRAPAAPSWAAARKISRDLCLTLAGARIVVSSASSYKATSRAPDQYVSSRATILHRPVGARVHWFSLAPER